MEPTTRARIAGALAGAVGLALLVFQQWGAGLAALACAAVALVLVTERGVPPETPGAGARGALAAEAALVRSLRLEGRGFVFPGGEGASRLYVPAREATFEEVAGHDPDLVMQRENVGAVGVLLPPPGAGLEAAWRDLHGLPTGAGAEEAAAHVRAALPQLGLGRDVSVARSDATLRVRYEPTSFAQECRDARERDAPWHLQGGCPACSLAAILAARAHAAPVKILDAGTDGTRVHLDLEVGPRS